MRKNAAEVVALGTVILLGICVRAYRIGAESLWADEAASWAFTMLPLADLWSVVPQYEPNPPLFYTLLKFWTQMFGASEAALRSLSALANILTIPAVYFLGRTAFQDRREGVWVGLVAALIFALHPVQIQYAQEARAYALLTLGCSLALLGLLWFAKHPDALAGSFKECLVAQNRQGWVFALLFVLGCDLALWSHYTAVLLLGSVVGVGVLLLLAGSPDRLRTLRNVAILGIVIIVLWLPGALWFLQGLTNVQSGFWIERPSRYHIAYVFDYLLGSAAAATTVETQLIGFALVSLLAAAGALRLVMRGQWPVAALLCTAVGLPLLVSIGTSYVVTPIFIARTLIWVQIAATVLVGAALLWLPRIWARASGAVVVLVVLLLGVTLAYPRKEPWREVVALLESQVQAPDEVVVWPSFALLPLRYYGFHERVPGRHPKLWNPESEAETYPSLSQVLSGGRLKVEALTHVRQDEIGGGRVWFITRVSSSDDTSTKIHSYLAETRGSPELPVERVGSLRLHVYPAKN